jgi:hypothetical protein
MFCAELDLCAAAHSAVVTVAATNSLQACARMHHWHFSVLTSSPPSPSCFGLAAGFVSSQVPPSTRHHHLNSSRCFACNCLTLYILMLLTSCKT